MKKIIYLFLLLPLFWLSINFFSNNSNKLLENKIVKTKTGEELLKAHREYINTSFDFYNEKKYLENSAEKELFIKKENGNYYFIEHNEKDNLNKKILIGEKVKEFKLDRGYLYYIKRNLVKEKDELYKLDINTDINELLVELNWIDNYSISKESIILEGMDIFYKYNKENKKIETFNAFGNLLDYDDKNLYIYDDSLKDNLCFYKLDINAIERKKCDLEVFFDKEKEVLIERPIKLEDDIYVLKFSKLKKIKVGSEDFLVFGIPIFKKAVVKVSPETKYFFKVIDIKNKKVSEKIKFYKDFD